MREKRSKLEEKKTTRKTISGWKDNVRMDLREMGCIDMGWLTLAQYRDP
jgi:hypothetical protein